MKKPIGIITTIISFIITSYSMFLIAASIFEEPTPYHNNEDLKEIGLAIAFLGIILFTLGLFLAASKSKKQRAMEISNLRYARDNK